jgi:hypothetical protein
MKQDTRSTSGSQSPLEERRHPATNAQIHDLLQSWLTEDAEEHRETWELLKRALDEDRPSARKLFP